MGQQQPQQMSACVGILQGQKISLLLQEWEPLLLKWPQLTSAAKIELLDRLASAEMAFFLACKDRTAFTEVRLSQPGQRRTVYQLVMEWGKRA